jgi:hypothetical protein
MKQIFAKDIAFKWVNLHIHKCLSSDDLFALYLEQSGCEENRSEDSLYGTPESVMKKYYQILQARVVSVMYADKKVYDLEELELLVPVVISDFYDRDAVIARYTEMVNQLKTPEQRQQRQHRQQLE